MESKKREIGIIWDFTGVLYKGGRKYVEKSFKEIFRMYDIDLPQKAFSERYRGQSLKQMFIDWEIDFGVSMPFSAQEYSIKSAKIELEFLKENVENEIDKDLINLLKNLKSNNIKMAIVSSSTKKRVYDILEVLKLKEYFDDNSIISFEDFKDKGSDYDGYVLASKKLNVDPQSCIVIEDSFHGIKDAKSLNMNTIGFANNSKEQEEFLREENPDLLIQDFKELSLEKLKKLI